MALARDTRGGLRPGGGAGRPDRDLAVGGAGDARELERLQPGRSPRLAQHLRGAAQPRSGHQRAVGELATAWEWTDDRTLRFTLREGVTFHDGSPFNAQVAADGVNFTWSAENAFDITQFMGPQISAAVVDEMTIDVSAAEPDPILPARLYFAPLPNMVQVEERPDSLPNEPIGTGPYQFVEWVRGDHISLTAYPEWWGNGDPEAAFGQQSIKDVQYVWRPESTVRAAQVTAGEAQIARFLAPDDCETTPVCLEAPSVETIFLRLDTMHPVMGDIRIREAIGLAVDKESLVEQIFGGGRWPPSSSARRRRPQRGADGPSLRHGARDAARPGGGGRRRSGRHGDHCRRPPGAYPRNEELGEYVANQLNEIGLNARTEVIEHAAYQEQYVMPYDEIPTDRGWIGTLGHGNEMMDVSQTFSGYYRCDGGVSTFCDPEIDAMTAESAVVTGEERVRGSPRRRRRSWSGSRDPDRPPSVLLRRRRRPELAAAPRRLHAGQGDVVHGVGGAGLGGVGLLRGWARSGEDDDARSPSSPSRAATPPRGSAATGTP